MALPLKYAGQAITSGGPPAINTVELFLDYVCPFSKKMFSTVYAGVFPNLKQDYPDGKVRFIVRQQIQPWHPSSTLVHEAAVAVLRLEGSKFLEFSNALFEHQTEYFDANVVNEVRNDTYKRLAKLAGSVGVDESKVFSLLQISDKPGEDGSLNTGNQVTNDIKVLTKMNRLQGVHVTPTVLFNGVVDNNIGSGSSASDWKSWLQKNVEAANK